MTKLGIHCEADHRQNEIKIVQVVGWTLIFRCDTADFKDFTKKRPLGRPKKHWGDKVRAVWTGIATDTDLSRK